MFGPDPIDLYDPSPYGPLAYYGHLAIGALALLAALAAFATYKGGRNHRWAGYVFFGALAVVCLTSAKMLYHVFIPPLFMAVFTAAYAVAGAWLALQRGTVRVRLAEAGLTVFEIVGLALFLDRALAAVAEGIVPPFAPWIIATIPLILLAGDANWFLRHKDRARLRLARHFSRMIWGFVVVFRAPLVELAAGGLPIPQPVVVIGPIAVGLAMLWYCRRRYLRPTARSV